MLHAAKILFFFLVFPEKPFINMKEPWTKVWEVNLGGPTPTHIPVEYTAYPEPSFKWYMVMSLISIQNKS